MARQNAEAAFDLAQQLATVEAPSDVAGVVDTREKAIRNADGASKRN
jgi:hypothetical protein